MSDPDASAGRPAPLAPGCPVCSEAMVPFGTHIVLGKYPADYHRCGGCGLVATLGPTWLPEAYEHAIHDADAGLLRRNRLLARLTAGIIKSEGIRGGRFLDWAGGYGLLTQLMREQGFAYWHHDDYAEAVFARQFADDGTMSYDLVSAFEVLEHLTDPVKELNAITGRSDLLLFSTQLLPEPAPPVGEWWYYMPEVGQHIMFHTPESLKRLASALGFQVTSNGSNWHVFHRRPLGVRTRILLSPALPAARARAVRLVGALRSAG